MDKSNLLIACAMLAGLAVPAIVCGQSPTPTPATAFTYQGYLAESGLPATGIYDLQFAIHASESGGDALAAPVEFGDVQVTDGLFAVTLDFGAAVFDGSQRWL